VIYYYCPLNNEKKGGCLGALQIEIDSEGDFEVII